MIRRSAVAVVAFFAIAGNADAQQSRAELVRSGTAAYDDFAPERALGILRQAANPALGPLDSVWVRSVHLLTQILVEGGNQDLARTWSRWAVRTLPTLPIDSVNFLAGVAAALQDARTVSARSAGDGVTQTSWRWSTPGSTETNGRIAVAQGAIPVPVAVRVVGGSVVSGDNGIVLPPGTYDIEAGAPGYLPARVSREVLPGITTLLSFALTPATVASETLTDAERQRVYASILPFTATRFSSAPSCAAGVFVGANLVLTSYQAIRGADDLTAAGAPQAGGAGLRVAAYDVAADLAVLHVSGTGRRDSLALASAVTDGQAAWGIRLAECGTPTDARTRIASWTDRPRGSLQISNPPATLAAASPLVDHQGRVLGVWMGGTAAVPAPRVTALLEQARRTVAGNDLTGIRDVSRRENHAYGSFALGTDVPQATANITPLESWQWSSLQTTGGVPLTFVGPMGRYRLVVSAPGGARREQTVTVRPGAHERIVVNLRQVAAGTEPSAAPARRKSKLPWILAAVGGAGLAGVLAMAGGGGGGDGGGGPPPPSSTGSISVSVPINPP